MKEALKNHPSRALLESLLVEEVTQGLARQQRAELERLSSEILSPEIQSLEGQSLETQGSQKGDAVDMAELERAATAIDYAFGLETLRPAPLVFDGETPERSAVVPADLDHRLAGLAKGFVASRLKAHTTDEEKPRPLSPTLPFDRTEDRTDPEAESLARPAGALERDRSRRTQAPWLGWWLAAVAALVALLGWWPRIGEGAERTEKLAEQLASSEAPEKASSPAQARDVISIPLAATEDPAANDAGGVAEWSTEAQSGLLRISGLAANDPGQMQYQLWIFDRAQDERYPIDGGVFDIPVSASPGEMVTIPIDAKLMVREPTLFAITVERPGGAVVSSRERIVLAGAVA